MDTKVCPKCGDEKSTDEFYKNKQTKDGLKSWCKLCCKADNNKREHKYNETRRTYREEHTEECREKKREYYRENKDRINSQNKAWTQTKKGRFTTYRNNAKHRSIEFNLTEDEFYGYWQQPCHYCGDDIDTVGVDRVDSKEGYTIDNTVPCCSVCNKMKLDLGVDVFISQIRKIYKHLEDK